MITDKNLMLCTVQELSQYLAKAICESNYLLGAFDGLECDYATDVVMGDGDSLEAVKSNSDRWYGIKPIDAGFDSDCLCLIADYYGGGAAHLAQIDEGMNVKEAAQEIEKIIMEPSNRLLIVEFTSQMKGGTTNEENNATKLDPKIVEIAENLGWKVTEYKNGTAEFSQPTPAGEGFRFTVNTKNAERRIFDYYNNFDVDNHVEKWIEAKNNGVSGVPSVRRLVTDAEELFEMLKKLAYAVRERSRDNNTATDFSDAPDEIKKQILENDRLLNRRNGV